MKTYREFQPTGCDSKGLRLPNRQSWLVFPAGRNRDSTILEESNFQSALTMLRQTANASDGLENESDSVEVHRFNHWACGWFEIILIDPSSHAAITAKELENALADYPVLDEHDLFERQYEAAAETWQHMPLQDRIQLAERFGFHLMACRRDELPEDTTGDLISYLAE